MILCIENVAILVDGTTRFWNNVHQIRLHP